MKHNFGNAEENDLLWSLTTRMYDYFGRMGGAGQYEGFRFWHIPAYVLLRLLNKTDEERFRDLASVLIHSELDTIFRTHFKEHLIELDAKIFDKSETYSYLAHIVNTLTRNEYWIDEIDGWTNFLAKLDIKITPDLLPEIVRYNGKRVKIIENCKQSKLFVDDRYPLTVIDKRITASVGGAKRIENDKYVGYIICGPHELGIDGSTIRELAHSAYLGILEAEKYF